MDPEEAVRILNDVDRDIKERQRTLISLGEWIANRGFIPTTRINPEVCAEFGKVAERINYMIGAKQ